jgi:hypothetical protein
VNTPVAPTPSAIFMALNVQAQKEPTISACRPSSLLSNSRVVPSQRGNVNDGRRLEGASVDQSVGQNQAAFSVSVINLRATHVISGS